MRSAAGTHRTGKVYRIGALSLTSVNNRTWAEGLAEPLAALGYVVGKNIGFVERDAGGSAERLPMLAADLVRLNVDLIVAGPAVAIRAAHDATKTIPIVMTFSGDDPVESGFVTSLAHPGGNVTGVTAQLRDIVPKMVELLRGTVPTLVHLGVLVNALRPEHVEYVKTMQEARPAGIQFHPVRVREPGEYKSAFATLTRDRVDAVVLLGDVQFTRDSRALAELAIEHRLPCIYVFKAFVKAGGLLSYGPDEFQLFSLACQYIDKILRGASPASLPVEQPTKFFLAVNRETAKAIGLTIPQSLLLRADEVI